MLKLADIWVLAMFLGPIFPWLLDCKRPKASLSLFLSKVLLTKTNLVFYCLCSTASVYCSTVRLVQCSTLLLYCTLQYHNTLY